MKLRRLVTRPNLAVVVLAYGAASAAAARASTIDGLALAGAIAAGVAAFSFVEYAVHRWLLHALAMRLGPRAYELAHGGHHRKPGDPSRRAVPLLYTVPVSAMLVGLARAAGGPGTGLGIAAGLLAGYVVFELVHAAVHTPRWGSRLKPLRRHHARHHHVDEGAAFGVSSPLWDWLLGTMPHQPHPWAVCPSPGDDTDHSEAI